MKKKSVHFEPLNHWRRQLDKDSSMRVSWDEFRKAVKRMKLDPYFFSAEKMWNATKDKKIIGVPEQFGGAEEMRALVEKIKQNSSNSVCYCSCDVIFD